MAFVADRWHKSRPTPDERPCKCGTPKKSLYPTREHGRGDRWQVRWRDETGKQCSANRPDRGGRKEETDPDRYAVALAAKITADLNADDYISPEAGKITLEAYAKVWRSGYVGEASSQDIIDKQLAHIYDVPAGPRSKRAPGKSVIGHRPLRELSKSPTLIQQWVKSLERKKLSAQYIHDIAALLSTIFNAAIADQRMRKNPLHSKTVTLPTIPDREVEAWDLRQVEAARAEVMRRQGSPAMVDLAAGAGLRQSEVFAFALEDIEWLGGNRRIKVRRQIKRVKAPDGKYHLVWALPKGGKERSVPLSDTLSARLSEQVTLREPVRITLPWGEVDGPLRTFTLLFVRPDGNPWYAQPFAYTWGKARVAAGFDPKDETGRFHGLRHTFASITLAMGVDVQKLAKWMGHKDPGFTLRKYTHFIPDKQDFGRRAIDAWFAAGDDSQSASARIVPEEPGR